jgi:uncharacterized membrane protein
LHLSEEINALRNEIARLQQTEVKPAIPAPKPACKTMVEIPILPKPQVKPAMPAHVVTAETLIAPKPQAKPIEKKEKSNLEKFIGENLISKIGIAITVIGVAIGAKYSIDHQLISPSLRIVLGYLFGFGLFGTAFYLRKKYVNFSAVLLSGSMAIMYFITYAAYSFYLLIPQVAAFALMFVFTAFTTLAALRYDRQIIAHIGMIGAYAIPLLLGNDSSDAPILFTYVSIINLGILMLSFVKYWKSLFYVAFSLTWLIYAIWYVDLLFATKLVFSSIFFVTFYAMFVCYKLLQKHKYSAGDIAVLLTNTFIFYGFNYTALTDDAEHLLGLFTLLNAAVHFAVAMLIYRQKLVDRNLFYLVIGLTLIFITIAIPVQLSGSWITLLWMGEAALLFWIGRTKAEPVYEKMSYPLLLFSTLSLIIDWYKRGSDVPAFMNVWLLSSLLFAAAAFFIAFIGRKYPATDLPKEWVKFLPDYGGKMIPVIATIAGLVCLYYAFFTEIYHCLTEGASSSMDSQNLLLARNVWLVCYTILFAVTLFWIGRTKAAPVYEKTSYRLLLLAAGGLIVTWIQRSSEALAFMNVWFLGSLLFAAAAFFIICICRKYPATILPEKWAETLPDCVDKNIPVIATIAGLVCLYYAFFAEIYHSFTEYSGSLLFFRNVWLVCYTLLFTVMLSVINFWKIKNKVLLTLNVFAVVVFLSVGLYNLSELRECYLESESSIFNIGIRYIAYLFAAAALFTIYRQSRKENLSVANEIFLHIVFLWIASSELIQWLDIAGIQSHKIGLSILWGIYSFALIALGILQKKAHLRICAIVLFGITLAKLFFYDIWHLGTITKTIVFMVLGVLLLGISFLYNKFKHRIY